MAIGIPYRARPELLVPSLPSLAAHLALEAIFAQGLDESHLPSVHPALFAPKAHYELPTCDALLDFSVQMEHKRLIRSETTLLFDPTRAHQVHTASQV